MKLISELKNKHKGADIYVMASGASLDYVDDSFFDNKLLISNNIAYKRYKNCKYVLTHHHNRVEDAITAGYDVVTSEYDMCISTEKHHSQLMGDHYLYKHAEQNHMGKVDLSVFDKDNYLACCSSTLGTTIHFAYYLGAKNIVVCGMDSVSINNKYYYDGYYNKDINKAMVYHINVTYKPILKIVNEIRRRGVNVVGLNPFINMKFENNIVN